MLNIKKALKRYKAIFVTFIVLGIVGIICFVLDYFNIPFKIGFNFNFLNLDDKRDLEVKNRIKKMFNIKRVYSKVSILYDSIGNRKLAEEYYKLYEEC